MGDSAAQRRFLPALAGRDVDQAQRRLYHGVDEVCRSVVSVPSCADCLLDLARRLRAQLDQLGECTVASKLRVTLCAQLSRSTIVRGPRGQSSKLAARLRRNCRALSLIRRSTAFCRARADTSRSSQLGRKFKSMCPNLPRNKGPASRGPRAIIQLLE